MRKALSRRRLVWLILTAVAVYLMVRVKELIELSGSVPVGDVFPRDIRHHDDAPHGPGCNCPKALASDVIPTSSAVDVVRNLSVVSNKTVVAVPRYTQFASKDFVTGHDRTLLILAYQRVGSSFFGKLLDRNPDVFYVYEPLDSLYSALYGTTDGFNVPSDITSHKNGSDRIIPPDESDAVVLFLEQLMSCQLDSLPTEYFVHKYWSFLPEFMPSWTRYVGCLKATGVTNGRGRCASRLHCPKRFGHQPWNTEQCASRLRAPRDETAPENVKLFRSCMSGIRDKAQDCLDVMRQKCQSASFRAVKTVRATMPEVTRMIRTNPNLRVIHLLREPRAVVSSRMKTETYHGLYAKNSSVRESRLYCSILVRDLRMRKQLERSHPGVFFEVLYEDFVRHPVEYTRSLYSFLDLKTDQDVLSWAQNSTRTKTTEKWKRFLTVDESEHILENCREFYDLVNYDFT